jgi:hypothetical protein
MFRPIVRDMTASMPTETPRDLQQEHEELMSRARELPGVATALEVQRLVDEAIPKAVMPLVAGVGYATGGNR